MLSNHYQPLFLKYRPQKLEDILGQNSVRETLINAIRSQKIVHAYLLTGPRGSGKTSTARILAKSLNCLNALDGLSPTTKPCGECESCVSISNSSSVDVIEIDAASHRKVEDARSLIEKVNFASISSKYRVYIIDEVHMLTTEAYNTLLKTIEEPPRNVVFILATTELDKVPKTIASRCQQLRFKPITINDSLERLNYVSQTEKINIDQEALALIAEHADGAMRDALSLLDQLSVFSDEKQVINASKVFDILGTVPKEQLYLLSKSILERDQEELLKVLEELLSSGRDSLLLTKELANYFLELLEQANSKSATSNNDLQKLVTVLKEKEIENFELVQIIDSLSELEIKLKQTLNSKNLLRAWLLKLCYRADLLVIRDLTKRLEALESGQAQPQTKAKTENTISTKPIKEVTSAPTETHQEEITNTRDESRSSFLDHLSPGSRGMYVSSNARLVSVNAGVALIQMPMKFKFLKSKLEARQEEIASAISKQEGSNISTLSIEVVDELNDEASTRDTATESKQENPISNSAKLNEVVNAGIGFFGGKEV